MIVGEEEFVDADEVLNEETYEEEEMALAEEIEIPEESNISKVLSDKATKTVVLLVLFLLFML